MGIRLPWTLADEDNWAYTHRLAGKVWTIGGLVILALTSCGCPCSSSL
ncbi:MAG: SdpI family protein [Evtepia gabavorous]